MIRKRNILGLSTAFVLVLAAWFLWGLRPEFHVPESQAELDRNRNSHLRFPGETDASVPEAYRLDAGYWRKRFGQRDVADDCGRSLRDGVEIRISRTFGTNTSATVTDGILVSVDFPYTHASAYRPADDRGNGAIFDPRADQVSLDRRVSRLSLRQKIRLWRLMNDDRLFELPEEGPDVGTMLDGTSGFVVVCRKGLRYFFIRNLNGGHVEPQLKELLGFSSRRMSHR